ncbi:hypothetical protein DAPPUDRAFT_247081 [Daphnia pulex]|uniref:Uncharacterized protein n=1 Tax=Daphnia pulex TaxID=6669 RepID=E9GRQ4_DAPPU|nr:hypothetical protein DAPPUDRAFT_247081 [Daphnia pulex]|eukprot:EFX77871.1 hypothetical protein DAPPUDRAFT_247081 [Daphnia pulex]
MEKKMGKEKKHKEKTEAGSYTRSTILDPQSTIGWEEETGVEIPASKSTLLRGHESEVFICA